MIFINFKTYPETTGVNAVTLQKLINTIADDFKVNIISVPQLIDFHRLFMHASQPVWIQHVDNEERGRATGWIIPEVAKELGASGTFLNHSEHKLSFDVLKATVEHCKKVELPVLIFAASLEEAQAVSELQPDYIGYEPPELIASTETSVAKAKPDIIENVVKALPKSKIIVGAGVKDQEDVKVSLKLGAVGVALASAVASAKNPAVILSDLARGERDRDNN
jgi:triosephosphate isomerase